MNVLTLFFIILAIAIAGAGVYWSRVKRARKQAQMQAAWLNREQEKPDSRVEVVEIWSDEQIERNDAQLAYEILEKVGKALSADDSMEGKRLHAFLAKVHPNLLNSEQTPRDIGIAWFSCMQIQDKEPAAELAQLFKELNDAWTATREGQTQKMILASGTILSGSATTLLQSDPQP